ncbi:DUF2607 domain-containing protein [Vibrio sp. IRLE0018]|uniref:DUF2607 family protein n=1 Tax=Vibrio TaxID=662 RepID=UPI00159412A1|nr:MULTISPECIES: DUF2607 family protein [Vibrio]MCF8780372.1 DUF2607 domain-containing protein [Vibrio floridensis]NVC63343.1 DUF2607 family protein [Vibrio sp. 05-20-BW147]
MNKLHHTALFAVVLSLFLSFASIAHDFDFNAEHHNSHHCQLFANAHHGVSPAVITIPIDPPSWFESTPPSFEAPVAIVTAYLARSPPVTAPQ